MPDSANRTGQSASHSEFPGRKGARTAQVILTPAHATLRIPDISMSTTVERINARSWLFAPGDSDKKMEKAAGSKADIVLIDLEDAVAEGEKAKARPMVASFIAAHAGQRERLWVRI